MHAVTYSRFGPAAEVLKFGTAEPARPKAGEVTVKLAFSGVNPSDVKARAGARPGVTTPPFPRICPHSDGAGTVTTVGDGVDPVRMGQRVWIWNGQWQRAMGTAATEITLPAAQAVPLPDAVSFETGACLGIPGLTAAHTVFGGGSVVGKTLLIHGGNGSVGHLAVQLAKWGGARVISTSSPRDFDTCACAGADTTLDYRSDKLSEEILDANNGELVDRIVDVEFGVNAETDAAVIAPNGVISVFGSAKNMTPQIPFGPLLFKAATIDIALIYILPNEKRTRACAMLDRALSDGALHCPVAEVVPLHDTARAHVIVETGTRSGAVLVDTTALE